MLLKLGLIFGYVAAISEVPLGISRQIYCETCHLMADELVLKLDELDGKGLEWEDEVIIILDHICGKRNFRESAKEFKVCVLNEKFPIYQINNFSK